MSEVYPNKKLVNLDEWKKNTHVMNWNLAIEA